MNILVITPTKGENKCMTATLARAGRTRHNYTVLCSGVGKAAAAANTALAVACADKRFDMIAVVGYAAGTLGFRQGDIVVPSTARYHDCNGIPDGFVPELTGEYALAGKEPITVFTGDSFVDADTIRAIKRHFGTERAIFDMEITAIAIAAKECGGLPVVAVKMISDVPEDGHTDKTFDEFSASHPDFGGLLERLEALP
ncbi:MAG: hypothetical protein ACI35T_05120 [Alistipes sp.]